MRTAPGVVAATSPATPAPGRPAQAHETDPALAAALFAAWSGDRIVVVASPPGAGKTRLVTHLAEQLNRRAGLDVAIAGQTRTQALDVANRAAAVGAKVSLLGAKPARSSSAVRPLGLHADVTWKPGAHTLRDHHGVVVATTARWLWTDPSAWTADVLIVEEAWQITFADLGALGPLAPQIVLVGDPGQIAPVVTGATDRWDTWAAGPHLPAPDALAAAHPDAVTRLRLPHTWRLGPVTTALIQPVFYADLPFTSARPARHVRLDGHPLPELSAETLAVSAGPNDPAVPAAAARYVRALLDSGTVHAADGTASRLTAADVAVVVPHVGQAGAIAAHLADEPDVLVATANQAQGLERDAVVVVHPLLGYREAPAFAIDPGRLCVALSRHRAHAHVLHDPATPGVLAAALRERPDDPAAAAQAHILDALRAA